MSAQVELQPAEGELQNLSEEQLQRPRELAATYRRALIVAFGFPVQYRALRCAVSAGLRVFVLGTPDAIALSYSRYCSGFMWMNTTEEQDAGQLSVVESEIREAIARFRIDLVIAADRDSVWCLGQLKDRIGVPVFPVPSTGDFEVLDDKWAFRELCTGLKIRTPRSWKFDDKRALLAAARNGEFPERIVVKPPRLWGGRGIITLRSQQLERGLKGIDYSPIIVQEFIEGEDCFCTLVTVKGKTAARLTCIDRPDAKYFGCEATVWEDAARICEHLRLDGIFCYDTRLGLDGKTYFLECNPRPFLSMQMCEQGGLNCIGSGILAMDGVTRLPAEMPVNTLKKWRGLVHAAFAPSTLTRKDRHRLMDTLRDPIPVLYELSETMNRRFPPGAAFVKVHRVSMRIENYLLASFGGAIRCVLGSNLPGVTKLRPGG